MRETRNLLTKALIGSALVASTTLFASAQISFGGEPASFSQPARSANSLRSIPGDKVIRVLPNFNPDDVRATNQWDVNQVHVKPLVIGKAINTNIDFARDAERIILDNGLVVYRLVIEAKGALSNILYYDDFFIPQDGGELYIYTPDRETVLGKFTHETHPTHGAFATSALPGSVAVMEYQLPLNSKEMPSILISSVGHLFTRADIGDPGEDTAHDNCAYNVNGSEGSDWQAEKAGVVQIQMLYSDGSMSVCSGNLLNNTNEDYRPYILSAAHCESVTAKRKTTDKDLDKWIFTFHYEKPNSSNGVSAISRNGTRSMVGCDMRAFLPIDGQSDGLLLELDQKIPDAYRVYYNGWDRSDVLPTSGVGIHHPSGDAKKISVYNGGVSSKTWDNKSARNGTRGATDAHFFFHFTKGETEGGSSGSSLWNQDKLVIGSLTGGGGRCESGTNYYGKLAYHWDKFKDSNNPLSEMAKYLDPKENGKAVKLEGTWKNKDKTLCPLPSVKNVLISREGDKLKVTWDAVPKENLAAGWTVKYNIKRNGKELEKKVETNEFSEPITEAEKDNNGTISYAVQARFEYGTPIASTPKEERYAVTDWVEQSIFVGERTKWVYVTKVQKEGNGVRLTWNQPYNFQEVTLFGTPSKDAAAYKPLTMGYSKLSFVSLPTPKEVTVVGKFPSDQMRSNTNSVYVHAVRLVPAKKEGTYKVFVQSSKEKSAAVSQPFTVPSNWKPGEWITVMLNKPVLINPEKVLYAGVTVPNQAYAPIVSYNQYANDALRKYVDGTVIVDFNESDLSYFGPSQTQSVFNEAPKGYLAISLLVSNVKSASSNGDNQSIFTTGKRVSPFPVVKNYIIKRKGQEVGRVPNTQREFVVQNGGEKDGYDVMVEYEEGVYTGNETIAAEVVAPGIYPTKIGQDALLHINGSESISTLSIYTVDGQLVKKITRPAAQISVEDLLPGQVYLVVLDTTQGRSTHRIRR